MGKDKNDKQKKQIAFLKIHLLKNKWARFLIALIIILFAGFVSISVIIYIQNQFPNTEELLALKKEKDAKLFQEADNSAQNLIFSGNVNDALAVYDKAISESDDQDLRLSLMFSKAVSLFNNNDYDRALEIANQIVDINQSHGYSDFIGQIYEEKGDKNNAIKYYQEAISLVDSSSPTAEADIYDYNFKINKLNEKAD